MLSRLLAAVVLLLPATAAAVTIRVPEHVATIQAAIHTASPSRVDTILVAPGTYPERLYIIGKNVVVRGAAGAARTTIDGGRGGNVVTISFVGRSCMLQDLTITGGASTFPDSVGSAIYINQGRPTIERCRLIGNNARGGGGIAGYVDAEPLVRDCWIAYNQGGGIFLELASDFPTWAEIVNTVIVRNWGAAVYAWKSARVRVTNCTIAHNTSDGVRGGEQARLAIERCIITDNGGGGVKRLDNRVCFQPLSCNNVYNNSGGNYLGTNPSDPCFSGRGSGDVSIDPCYQNVELDNFHLQNTSPLCSLRQPDGCGALGAYLDPCSSGGSCVVAAVQLPWSGVKHLYRD